MKQKKKNRVWKGTLAGEMFAALLPYIDPYNCGEWYTGYDSKGKWHDGPHFDITHEQRAARHTNPRAYHAGVLKPARIEKGIQFDNQYFTCNKGGIDKDGRHRTKSLTYVDIDDHDNQTDKAALTADILKRFPKLFLNEGRLWLKADWGVETFDRFKTAYTKFLEALESYRKSKGFQSNIDSAKGITQLGRLPLKNLTYRKYQEFVATPDVTPAELRDWTRQLLEDSGSASPHASSLGARKPVTSLAAQGKVNLYKSLSGMPLSQDELDSIPDRIRHHKSLSYKLTEAARNNMKLYVAKGQKLYSQDVVCGLVVLDLLYSHKNETGELPQARVKSWWNWLYSQDYFSRAFSDSKWARLWRLFADCGVIEVADSTYWFHPDGNKKGKCMEYSMKEEYLAASATSEKEEEASIQKATITFLPNICRPTRISAPDRQPDYWSRPKMAKLLDQTLYEVAA